MPIEEFGLMTRIRRKGGSWFGGRGAAVDDVGVGGPDMDATGTDEYGPGLKRGAMMGYGGTICEIWLEFALEGGRGGIEISGAGVDIVGGEIDGGRVESAREERECSELLSFMSCPSESPNFLFIFLVAISNMRLQPDLAAFGSLAKILIA
jgi:hypothetical protein